MFRISNYPEQEVDKEINIFSRFLVPVGEGPNPEVEGLLELLTVENTWGERKKVAWLLGSSRSVEAIPGLSVILLEDPFWMVRFAAVQALEMIGDPATIPALQVASESDSYQVIRSYALKALGRLS